MKLNKIKIGVIATVFLTILSVSSFSSVQAQTITPGAKKAANQQQKIATLIARGDAEITKRIAALNSAIAKVQALKKLTDAQKSPLVSIYDAVILNLSTLKTKIDADTNLSTLSVDVKSIFESYRVYALVLPQTNILAASDRIQDVVADMNILSNKLQTRISDAQTKGKDVTKLQESFTDFKAKVSDAQTNAQNAVNEVSSLTPDQGDKTKLASNNQAIQTARTAIKTGLKDLEAARDNAQSIVAGLKDLK